MRNAVGCLVAVAVFVMAVLLFGAFGLVSLRVAARPSPTQVAVRPAASGNGAMHPSEMPEPSPVVTMHSESFFVWSRVVMLAGGLFLAVLIPVAILFAVLRVVSGPAAAPPGQPTVFDVALAVHRRLESVDARVERLESRLLGRCGSFAGGRSGESA